MKHHVIYFSALVAVAFSPSSYASVVKKSRSDICHAPNSSYYDTVKNFKSFDSLQSCLDSGGRLPKGSKNTSSSSSQLVGTAYKRNYFGNGWADFDRDCQNSRMEALISQSTGQVHYKTDKQCKVVSGRWISPFSGKVLYKASEVDIDHVVPLKWAWDHGANKWTSEKRKRFANDPANLLSVERSLNRQKGAKGLGKWLPPKNQCQYIVRFERVVKTYSLNLSSQQNIEYQALKGKYC